MASASYSAKLSESKYNNLVKAGLAVLFTKEGIEPFVDDEIKEFQQKCLTDICNNNGLPVGSTCSNCCTENVVVCPTNRICNSGRRRCPFHRNNATQYLPNGCPNKICHSFKNEIQSAHRFSGPSYKNTDATKWCSNPWEVAKCFMPPDGYKDVTSAAETDFNGINSVIINCKFFQSKIHDNLRNKNNIFEKARVIGRAVRHSPTLEVEDTDLNQYFTDLQTLLSDPGYLTTDAAANNARKKLKELQNDTLVIGREEIKKVLDDVAKAVQYRIKSESEKQQNNHEKQKLELIQETKKSLLAISRHKNISVSLLKIAVSSALSKIEESTKKSLEKIHAQTQRGKKRVLQETETSVKTIEEETERGKRKVIKTTDEGVETIAKATDGALEKITKRKTTLPAQKDEDKYNKLQKDLQADLVTYYRDKCKTIPVSPALEESEVPLSKVYIPPYPMYSIETDKLKMMSEKRRKENPATQIGIQETEGEEVDLVDSLSKIFCQRTKVCKNIYVTADPGVGKTSFVKWLTLNWCQAHCPLSEDSAYFQQEDVDQMKKFEFLFVVFLRETTDIKVDVIIMNMTSELARQAAYTPEALERILHGHNCLIVLDGLDEWASSEPAVLIPKRNAREKCTYLTTSRPWKFCMLPLNSTQIDHHIQIKNVSKVCIKKLLPKIFLLFEERQCLTSDVTDVNDACQKFRNLLEAKKLTHFHDKPVMFVQLIYLWNMTGRIGNTQCEIYREMIADWFTVTESKSPQLLSKFKNKRCTRLIGFKSSSCGTYYDLMLKLGKLAFETLFSENKESSLVFDEALALKYLPADENATSEEILSVCLHSGLLSRQASYVGARRKMYTCTFYHKTIQEYFAALYLQSNFQDDETAKKVHKRCSSLSDVLEMGTVFMFLSGLDPTSTCALLQALQDVISKDAGTIAFRSKYFSRDDKEYRQIKEAQDMIVSCATESKDNGHDDIQFTLEDVFVDSSCNEDSYSCALKSLIEKNYHNIKSLNISSSNMTNAYDACTDFKLSQIQSVCTLNADTKHALNELHCLLKKSTTCLKCLSSGYYVSPNDTLLDPEVIDTMTAIVHLEALNLQGIDVPHKKLRTFVEYVEQQTHLRYLYLCTKYRHQILHSLKLNLSEHENLHEVTFLSMPLSKLTLNDNLKQLRLQDMPLKELKVNKNLQQLELCKVQLTRLQLHGNLQILDLDGVPLSEFGGNLASLKYCSIFDLPAGVASDVFRRLPVKLHSLICSDLESHEDVTSFLDAVPKLKHLKEVEICNADFSRGSIVLQPEMKQLQSVELAGISLTNTSLQMLVNTVLEFEQTLLLKFSDVNLINDSSEQRQLLPTVIEDCSQYGMKTVKVFRSTLTASTYLMLVDTLLKCEQDITIVFSGIEVAGNAGAPCSVTHLPQMRGNNSNYVRKYIRMDDVQIRSGLLQNFIYAIERCQYHVSVKLFRCFEEGSLSVQNYIRSSSSFITTWYTNERLDLSTR